MMALRRREPRELIGAGPNLQLRADGIGNTLVGLLEKQAEAMTKLLRLYRVYRAECAGRGLRVKYPALMRSSGTGRPVTTIDPSERGASRRIPSDSD